MVPACSLAPAYPMPRAASVSVARILTDCKSETGLDARLITNCQFIRTETIEESQQSRVSGDCRPDLKGCASCISRKRLIARSHNNVL
jgi:hypothetical protein